MIRQKSNTKKKSYRKSPTKKSYRKSPKKKSYRKSPKKKSYRKSPKKKSYRKKSRMNSERMDRLPDPISEYIYKLSDRSFNKCSNEFLKIKIKNNEEKLYDLIKEIILLNYGEDEKSEHFENLRELTTEKLIKSENIDKWDTKKINIFSWDLSLSELTLLPDSFINLKIEGDLNLANNQLRSLPKYFFDKIKIEGKLNLSGNDFDNEYFRKFKDNIMNNNI